MSLRERRLKARRRRNAVAGSMAIGAVLAAPATADAATFTVSNLADSGGGSLRDALAQANSDPESADDIVFQSGLSGQITLSSSLNVLSRVDIHGPGANVITVSGNDATRVFDVGLGDRQASISGLTITDGATGSGGGIFHEGGTLIVSDSVISGSEADEGGGIFFQGQNDNSRLVVQRSTISGNAAGASGGGGISGLVSLDGSEFASSAIEIRDSTISGNQSGAAGGGLYAKTQAYGLPCPPSDPECDGPIASAHLAVIVERTTIAGNTAATAGGGIFTRQSENSAGSASTQAALNSTIVGDNLVGLTPNDTDGDEASNIFADFSLIEADSKPVAAALNGSNIFGQDPQLGPLAMNGGPTPTQAIPKTSPALDKGRSGGFTPMRLAAAAPAPSNSSVDQRGMPRPVNFPDVPNSAARPWDATDMGAFELQIPPPPPPPAECNATVVTKEGTAGPDVIRGTSKRDVIAGHGGNDTILGFGGNDLICGEGGKDKVLGGPGADVFFGGKGADNMKGGGGPDFLLGEAGGDTLAGDAGKDTLLGGGGGDKLFGGKGADELKGGGGRDKLVGGAGKDVEKQ